MKVGLVNLCLCFRLDISFRFWMGICGRERRAWIFCNGYRGKGGYGHMRMSGHICGQIRLEAGYIFVQMEQENYFFDYSTWEYRKVDKN